MKPLVSSTFQHRSQALLQIEQFSDTKPTKFVKSFNFFKLSSTKIKFKIQRNKRFLIFFCSSFFKLERFCIVLFLAVFSNSDLRPTPQLRMELMNKNCFDTQKEFVTGQIRTRYYIGDNMSTYKCHLHSSNFYFHNPSTLIYIIKTLKC